MPEALAAMSDYVASQSLAVVQELNVIVLIAFVQISLKLLGASQACAFENRRCLLVPCSSFSA